METQNDAVLAALESRLEALQQEIDRLIRTAPTLYDQKQQQDCWDHARDLQREARMLREQILRGHGRAQTAPTT